MNDDEAVYCIKGFIRQWRLDKNKSASLRRKIEKGKKIVYFSIAVESRLSSSLTLSNIVELNELSSSAIC